MMECKILQYIQSCISPLRESQQIILKRKKLKHIFFIYFKDYLEYKDER